MYNRKCICPRMSSKPIRSHRQGPKISVRPYLNPSLSTCYINSVSVYNSIIEDDMKYELQRSTERELSGWKRVFQPATAERIEHLLIDLLVLLRYRMSHDPVTNETRSVRNRLTTLPYYFLHWILQLAFGFGKFTTEFV